MSEDTFMPIMSAYIAKDEIVHFPKGVKPMSNDPLPKIRECVTRDAYLALGYDGNPVHRCVFIQNYLLLQVLDKLESMSLALDAMHDYQAAQWHEGKIKE
jgi:hypothetical protein